MKKIAFENVSKMFPTLMDNAPEYLCFTHFEFSANIFGNCNDKRCVRKSVNVNSIMPNGTCPHPVFKSCILTALLFKETPSHNMFSIFHMKLLNSQKHWCFNDFWSNNDLVCLWNQNKLPLSLPWGDNGWRQIEHFMGLMDHYICSLQSKASRFFCSAVKGNFTGQAGQKINAPKTDRLQIAADSVCLLHFTRHEAHDASSASLSASAHA